MAKKKQKGRGDDATNATSPLSDKQISMLDALERSHAIISEACKKAGINRSTHYRWIDDNEVYAQAYADIEESAIDHVESKMFERIDEGSDGLIKFYLATKGKKRGYIEKTQHEHSISKEIPDWLDGNLNIDES